MNIIECVLGCAMHPPLFSGSWTEFFANENYNYVIPYFDDIIFFSDNETEHYSHVEKVMQLLEKNKI